MGGRDAALAIEFAGPAGDHESDSDPRDADAGSASSLRLDTAAGTCGPEVDVADEPFG